MNQEKIHERFLGVATTGKIYNLNDEEDYHIYEPSSYSALVSLFDEIQLNPQDIVVDFGCGLGRVLFYCNQRFWCRVKGIEIDEEVYERVLDNKAYYSNRFMDREPEIEIILGKAEEYKIQPEENIFYFFNPFSERIFEKILYNIKVSLSEAPRNIKIILYYTQEEYRELLKENHYVMDKLIRLPEYQYDCYEKVYVYRNY